MSAVTTSEQKRRQVFLSYAQEDSNLANQVADALRDAGLGVSWDKWELGFGDSIAKRTHEAVAASDLLLVLLSPASVKSKWVQQELNAALSMELRDRAVAIIPAIIEDCEIPTGLADRQIVDLRHDFHGGIRRLVDQLLAVPDVDYSKLDAALFEQLVADLLIGLGFSIQRTSLTKDSGFDFVATRQSDDPFGAEKRDAWFVEAKLYKDQRVSVASLRQMLGYLMTSPNRRKGLVVTNGQLTSVARAFLADSSEKAGNEIRLIDGTQLTNLLLQRPELIRRYFTNGGGHE